MPEDSLSNKHSKLLMDKFHDSAGVPWEGRKFSDSPFADDDGSTPPALAKVLQAERLDKKELFSALSQSRLLIPLLANLGESEVGPFGQVVDKSAELSVVAVATPDNQSALPVFSSVQQMQAWNASARPVPVDSRRVALAAVAEGHNRVVLDPSTRSIGLRRPFLAALAQGHDWTPPHNNETVIGLVAQDVKNLATISNVELLDPDPEGKLLTSELLISLTMVPGLSPQTIREILEELTIRIQTEQFLALVDSISYRVVSA